MSLIIGKRYRTARGKIETVGGICKNYREWVWTIQGNWYRQSDGRYITLKTTRDKAGDVIGIDPCPSETLTGLDLIEEVSHE